MKRSVFTDLAGGAILAGGVRRNAHHPGNPRQINRQLIVWNNRIRSVSEEYQDNSAILSTYIEGATILHNDISDVPYDAMTSVTAGVCRTRAATRIIASVCMATTGRRTWCMPHPPRIATWWWPAIASTMPKSCFTTAARFITSRPAPETLITEKYIFDNYGEIGLYLDEGSRYITVRRNIVEDPRSEWLSVNTVHSAYPMRISPDNTAVANWHDGPLGQLSEQPHPRRPSGYAAATDQRMRER